MKLSLVLDQMGCGACVANVRKALGTLPGVAIDDVSVGSVTLTLDPDRTSQQVVRDALARAGYPVLAVTQPTSAAAPMPTGGCCGN